MRWTVILLFASFSRPFTFIPFISGLAYNNTWKKRAKTCRKSSSFHDCGVLYKQSVLSKQEYDEVKKEVEKLSLVPEQASIAHNRIGAVIPERAHEIFQHGSVSRLVQSVMGKNYVLSENIPVEVRVYEKAGARMDWHVDDVLYDPPQVEVVFILENSSDCTTRWKLSDEEMIVKETDPNSVLLLQAGTVLHCVTPLKRGRRVIIKCAFVSREAVFSKGALVTQFAMNKKQRSRR